MSGPHTIPTRTASGRSTLPNARDASVFADTQTESFAFLTAWYFTPPAELGKADGFGNPNNNNTGFVQLFDTDGSSVDSLNAGWNGARTTFSVEASGSDAGSAEAARLWPAPETGGAASITAGTFLSYDFDLDATFATPAAGDIRTGETPTGVNGAFSGIFRNTGGDAALNGFYVFDFALQGGSSAANGDYVAQFRDGDDFASTAARTFAAPVPLPAGLPLLAGALALAGVVGRRRN
jgi:hypothetical protein